MNTDYSEYYHHDYDGDGMPYSYPVNPVHTIFSLQGSKDAIIRAQREVTAMWVGLPPDDIEIVKLYFLGDHYNIDIQTNNYIPQIYYGLNNIEGVTDISYVVYDTAHGRMITNNLNMGTAIARAFKLDVNIEVDDEPDMFPEQTELSLPDLNDAD